MGLTMPIAWDLTVLFWFTRQSDPILRIYQLNDASNVPNEDLNPILKLHLDQNSK